MPARKIDIKPGAPNCISPAGQGTIPVALLSGPNFAAPNAIDLTSLSFGRTGSEPSLVSCNTSPQDLNGDGLPDEECSFSNSAAGFLAGDTQGILRGRLRNGTWFQAASPIIIDTTPPSIGAVTATPNVLWPPNHKMVQVMVTAIASDICDATPVCMISEVTSNEPIDGLGDGDTAPDWQITGNLTVNLRAERSGTGSGRVYSVKVKCTDASGNMATKTVTVLAPHDQRP